MNLQRLDRPLRGTFVLAVLAAGMTPPTARSHSLLLTQGEVVVDEGRAKVELEVAVEDFMHWYGFGPEANGTVSARAFQELLERHAFALHRIFVITDADGNPLPSDPFRFRFDWPNKNVVTFGELRPLRVQYTTHFHYPSIPRFLTLQLWMDRDGPSIRWQTVLRVRGSAPEDPGRVLRLTSEGNGETIEMRRSDNGTRLVTKSASALTCPDVSPSGRKQICADIKIGSDTVEVRMAIPITLLQTWLALAANDDAFLEPEQQQSAKSKIEPLLAGALSVETAGRKYSGQIIELEFLPMDVDETRPPVERRRLSIFTGRVDATLLFGPFTDLAQADFQWNLFNNAVVTVVATIDGNGSVIRHEFSTYQPTFHWRRGLSKSEVP